MLAVRMRIKNDKKVQRQIERSMRRLNGPPMFRAMGKATFYVQRKAKQPPAMPVDTGRLRAGLLPEVQQLRTQVKGIIYDDVEYAIFQEQGTRFMPGKWFLWGAIEDSREQILRLLQAGVIEAIER